MPATETTIEHYERPEVKAVIFKEYPAACCGDGQETVLRKAVYYASND